MYNSFKKLLIAGAVVAFPGLSVKAAQLSEARLFNRCYAQLTSRPVPLDSSYMKQVKAGTMTALAACKEILRKGRLNSSGSLSDTTDLEAKGVLNTFYSFHRSWFPVNTSDSIIGYDGTEHNGTIDAYDFTEPALALTFSQFGYNQKYSDTLTRSTGVVAVRQEDEAVKARYGWVPSLPNRVSSIFRTADAMNAKMQFRSLDNETTPLSPYSQSATSHSGFFLLMPTIQVGDLVGVKANTQSFTVPNFSLAPVNYGYIGSGENAYYNRTNLNYSYDFFKTYGGGVLGTPIYLLQYLGFALNTKFNGQVQVPRRWSQQNMESFLCKELPALRESDVQSFLVGTSTAPFRNSASCLTCHATLDPMAYTARNITTGTSDWRRVLFADDTASTYVSSKVMNIVASYKALNASVSGWPSEPVTNFHLQQPTGRLYFRSFTGALIDKSVTGIDGLGAAMADTDDYYLCAAKRYFKFMTGVDVALYDRTDPINVERNKAISSQELLEYQFIQQLANELRASGSVINVIDRIMESAYYQNTDYRN